MTCMSNHRHAAQWAARICDQNLMVRVQQDREAPILAPAPRWLNRQGKDLTGRIEAN